MTPEEIKEAWRIYDAWEERQRLRDTVVKAAMADYITSRSHFSYPVTHTEDQCRLAVHNLMLACVDLEEFEARPMQEIRERLGAGQEPPK